MKTSFALLLTATLSTQAMIIHFDLSPPGTSPAVGLSPSNQVPVVTNSTGSGNAISGGIVYDSVSNLMQVAIGYGSAAGFRNLSGEATAMHIHGPATVSQAAGILVSLVPFNFTADEPTNGGVIYGNFAFPTNEVSNLLAGLTYVNIHTVLNPGGEIRGQLIPRIASNAPPLVSCPFNSQVECGQLSEVKVLVADPDGDALEVVWHVNGVAIQTNRVPASQPPPTQTNVTFSAIMPLGTNVVTVLVTDSAGNTASCSTLVTAVDTLPPVISNLRAVPNVLWPPNHKMVDVELRATVRDACTTSTWKITRVTSNDTLFARGGGDTSPDWQITGPHTLKLRAERSGKGEGRVYTISVVATDAVGNASAPSMVTVTVPHDRGK